MDCQKAFRAPDAFWSCFDDFEVAAEKMQGQGCQPLGWVLFIALSLLHTNHSRAAHRQSGPRKACGHHVSAKDGQASDDGM